jgi:glycyl-tRNA synthetase
MFTLEQIVNYAKKNGYVFQGSEIYGGLANSWDYGPAGIALKNNLKRLWWQRFIQEQNNVGLDSSIIMNSQIWQASGHVGGFNDPLIDCKSCNSRFRADKLIEDNMDVTKLEKSVEAYSQEDMQALVTENINCPNCGKNDWTDIRQFELMFSTNMGVIKDDSSKVYLRPETAQGIFVNFKNVQTSSRRKIPFGIGQVGKSFRNEITPGNFIFRTREFEQMELEFFINPSESKKWFEFYQNECIKFLNDINIKSDNFVVREHDQDELSHYSSATTDIEYKFPFGQSELWGIADRGNFDLTVHQENSKSDMSYLDPFTNERYIPHCIEPSVGVDRLMLAILCDGLEVETLSEKDERVLFKVHPALAPYKITLLPLVKKYHSQKAEELFTKLSSEFAVDYDDTGSIGKRYRRSDELGTPFCVTVYDNTTNNNTVTIRDRDTMEQITLTVEEMIEYIKEKIKF